MRPGRGKMQQARLRKAVSTAYYALFHRLLRLGADHMIGRKAKKEAYERVYRSLQHSDAIRRCRQSQLGPLLGFGEVLSALQEARHQADYDPFAKFTPRQARDLVNRAHAAITQLEQAEKWDQKNFVALVFFGQKGR